MATGLGRNIFAFGKDCKSAMGHIISPIQLLLSLGGFLLFLIVGTPLIILVKHFLKKDHRTYHCHSFPEVLRQPHIGNYQRSWEATEMLLQIILALVFFFFLIHVF